MVCVVCVWWVVRVTMGVGGGWWVVLGVGCWVFGVVVVVLCCDSCGCAGRCTEGTLAEELEQFEVLHAAQGHGTRRCRLNGYTASVAHDETACNENVRIKGVHLEGNHRTRRAAGADYRVNR